MAPVTARAVQAAREPVPASPRFTVLTPTYERAATLPRVFASLCEQANADFEWLVVDDGSTDGTEALVTGWAAVAPFPVRYVRQPNGGKPSAVNRGVTEARGEFTAVLDSDDACVPRALETLARVWDEIPASERHRFSGVSVLAATPDGRVVGTPFPSERVDAHPHELSLRHGVRGEKWGMHRTELLRAALYPVTPGERWMPEAVMWNRLGRRYLVRHANVALRIYEPSADGITARIRQLMLRNPTGVALYYRELLDLDVPLRWRLGAALRYVRFGLRAGRTATQLVGGAGDRLATLAALPAGAAASLLDRLRYGAHRRSDDDGSPPASA
jgi:glycosyltransferase involved in cell wall biosynthesis